MIHAQRPDATACAPLETWNKPMNRYVRRGSKGIALIDTTGDKPRLRYVFDISDTEDGYRNPTRRPYIWEMKSEHETAVLEVLGDTYKTGNINENVGDMIYDLAQELSTRYYEDNKTDIGYSVGDSFLEDFDEFNISVAYKEALTVSAAYAIMSRCGIDTTEHLYDEDFQAIFDFNTVESANALGSGVSAVSEEILREIEAVIKNYERQKAAERSNEHEQPDLQPERGVSDTRHIADGNNASTQQVRNDAEELFEGTPPDTALPPDPARETVFPLFGNRAYSEQQAGADDAETDEAVTATEQSDRPDGLDSTHEQPEADSGRNHSQRTNPQLNAENSETPIPVDGVSAFLDDVITDDEINTFLIGGSGTQDGKYRIYSFFLHEHTAKEKAGFLKNEYGTGGRTHAFPTADHSYADYDSKGLSLKKGDILTPDVEVTLTWTNVANRIDSLMVDELYMSQEELDYLPRYERQILGADVQQFFSGLPLDMQRPFEVDDSPYPDFWSVSTKIGNTLDNPETLKNILAAMHPIMENTTNSSHYYNTRKIALENLKAFENGTFTLFPQISVVQADTELPTAEAVQEPPMQMTLFPSVVEQMALIEEAEQLETAALPVSITQEDIDNALRQWNGTLDSKILVHEYMRENARARDTANFLKTEFEQYGGEMPVFTITKDGAEPVALPWPKVQKHIGRLMEAGQFLTPEEQAYTDRELNDSHEDMPEQETAQPTDIQELYRYYYRTADRPPVNGVVEAHSPDEAEQLIPHDNYVLIRVELASVPEKPIAVAPVYAIGDTVYLEADRRFIIEDITVREVKLLDPSLYIPITRAMRIGEFEREFFRNPKNAATPPITEASQQEQTSSDNLPEAETIAEAPTTEMTPTATTTIADFVKFKLEAGEKFTSAELFAEAAKAYGDTMANNAFTSKDAYDAMELGVNQYMLSLDDISLENILETLELIPSQTRRTADMERFQQFSTPPSIAYLANWTANIKSDDTVLEPSAGNGGIAVFAKKDGATVYVNELDKRRLEVIKNLPFDGFFNEDAEQINNIHGDKIEPTVIVMNPPFSSSAERNIHNTKIGAKHIEEALKMLAPNGRLVAVVGQGMADDAPAFRNWWREIKAEYNVKANIGIDGKNYNKYGTTFGIQMLVIDKDGITTEPVKTAFVDNLLDLQNILGGIRNDRPSIEPEHDNENEQQSAAPTRHDAVAEREPEHKPHEPVSDAGGGTDTADIGVGREQTVTSEIDAVFDGTAASAPDPASVGVDGLAPIVHGERHRGNDGRDDVSDGASRTGAVDSGQSVGRTQPRIKPPKPVKTELTDSIFENYEPQPLLLQNAQPHPANISESAAMSAIQPPTVTYKPNLSQDIIDKGILSDVQLEAVTYAGQSHSQTLPDGNTRGFFLGDGTGVGKGRTITGVILDNFNQGSKKAVWLSENRGLVPDAKRDVAALFGNSDLVTEFEGGKKADKSLSSDEAILFTTYSSLSKGFEQSGSNFEKIVNWLGKDFDGVIVFDEAHNMANSIATKGNRGIKKASQRGMAGLAIQEALPNAKIIYSSATGATEVENLRYAERLGLWGEGTAFPNGDDFVHRIKAGGLAAMELIARDMKAMGVYLSRNISYEDVVYDKIVHELTPEQRTIYDELARSWQIVLQNLNKALETTNQNKDGMAKGKAYGAFWSAEQRFFNQILTAMQVPSMITDMKKQLDDDNSIVIQLVSTNESAQEREFARLQEQDLDLEDFDLTPKQMLMSYIENSFPTVQFEEYLDDNGNLRSKPVYDSEGNAVINREAVRQKEMLLDRLGSIKVPASALDMIINHFGSDMVAENTGRKRRVVVKDGKAKEENIAHKKQADVSAFQDGDKRIIVFSKAGGTGKSYHADKSAKNQQHRVHYLLQAGWQADAAVQGFGRSHRSNQVSSPTFALVTTDLKGQMRFISTIAKRLDQLGALTKGQRQTGSQGLFTAGDNLENAFAADVLSMFYKTLILNRVEGIPDGVSIIEKLGLKDRLIDEYGSIRTNAQELREVNKFLNRILSLECHEQNAVFDGYAERLLIATEKAMQDGTLDKGLENYRADKVVLNEVQDIKADESTGAVTKYYSLTAHNKIKPLQFGKINTENDAFMGFYQSKNTGAVRAVFKTSSMTDEYGNISENCRLTGQDGNEYIPQSRLMSNWDQLTPEKAEQLWNDAVSELPEFRTNNLHLIGGTVLPVWDKLPSDNVRIYRVLTTDGDLLIGRVVPEDMIDATLCRLGAERERENIKTEDLIKGIKNGDTVHLDNDWRVVQRRVSNEQRIEVMGPDYLHSDLLTKKGVFTERIGYQTRYFIPAEKDTASILSEVIRISPVIRIENSSDRMAAKSSAAKAKPSILEMLKQNAEKSRQTYGDKSATDKKNEISI
jgi:Type III restriction enzyme, res subunit./Methyltransferase small domain.